MLKQLAFDRMLRAKCGPGDDTSTTETTTTGMIERSKPNKETKAPIPYKTTLKSDAGATLVPNECLKDLAMMRQARASQHLQDLDRNWSDFCVTNASIEHDSRKHKHQEHFEDIGTIGSEDENSDDAGSLDGVQETDRVISREECTQRLDELESFVLEQGLPKPFARLAVAKSRGNQEW